MNKKKAWFSFNTELDMWLFGLVNLRQNANPGCSQRNNLKAQMSQQWRHAGSSASTLPIILGPSLGLKEYLSCYKKHTAIFIELKVKIQIVLKANFQL